MNYVSALLNAAILEPINLSSKIDAIKSSDDDLVERLDKFFKKNQKDIEDWKEELEKIMKWKQKQ